jgi:hypothetical protein
MEESAMSRDHESPAMEGLCPGEVIEKKVDRVNMDDVGALDVSEHRKRDGIALGAEIWDANDFDAAHILDGRQFFPMWGVEQAVERDDSYALASGRLRGGKVRDDVFQTTHAGVKLPHDVNDEHLERAPWRDFQAKSELRAESNAQPPMPTI